MQKLASLFKATSFLSQLFDDTSSHIFLCPTSHRFQLLGPISQQWLVLSAMYDSVIFVTATLLAHNGLLAVTAPLTNGWIRSLSHSGQVLVLVCNPRLSCLACSVSRDCRDAVAPHITGFSEHNQLLSSDSHSSKEQQRASERQARVSEQLREHGRPLEGPPCPFKLRLA